ncbi:hypothetical protein [Paenibacillus sp. FSL K6-2524]|uniref:hypothetical protein n=1 Tax=Paenibacillus sp. FSL K6-2524 TaxID=2954516 RepID=UPI0030FB9699
MNKKQFNRLLISLILIFSMAACSTPEKKLVINDQDITKGEIYLGMTFDDVLEKIRLLNLELYSEDTEEGIENSRTVKMLGTNEYIFNFDNSLKLVSISTLDTLTTPSGLESGSSIVTMKQIYGNNTDTAQEGEFTLYRYNKGDYSLVFYTLNSKVYYWSIYQDCNFEMIDKNFSYSCNN